MKGLIQGKSHMAVNIVKKHLLKKLVRISMRELTQGKYHMYANTVTKDFVTSAVSLSMKRKNTQEKNHINVKLARSVSLNQVD